MPKVRENAFLTNAFTDIAFYMRYTMPTWWEGLSPEDKAYFEGMVGNMAALSKRYPGFENGMDTSQPDLFA